MNPTYLYLTTQTSATDSMLRIFCRIGGFSFSESKFIDRFLLDHRAKDLLDVEYPADGLLHRFNLPPFFDPKKVRSFHKLIVNFRDPRDHLCNVFHWQFNHPHRLMSDEERKVYLEEVSRQGIDDFVLKKCDAKYYHNIIETLRHVDPERYIVLSYARLCIDFDSFLTETFRFFRKDPAPSVIDELECERVVNLKNNRDYIGNRWPGADLMPGRYKRELKESTIKKLNDVLSSTLRSMAFYDPRFAHLYLEGVEG